MALRSEYLKFLRIDPRPRLFGFATPGPVRARALRTLEDRPDSDFLIRHALKDCSGYEPRTHLLATWRADGTWGTDRLFLRRHGEIAAQDRLLVDTIRNLTLLELFLWTPAEGGGRLQQATEALLSRAADDGFLGFISPGADWTRGEPATIVRSDHWGGFAVAALLRLGAKHAAIDRYLDRLERTQRADGGWLSEYHAAGKTENDALPSHPLHTISAAAALSADTQRAESECFRRAVAFLLERCFTRVGNYERSTAGRWERWSEPDFGYGALQVLALAAEAGIDKEDPRVEKILGWLRGEQEDIGIWLPDGKEMDGHPDESSFLTLKVAGTVRRIVDFNSDSGTDGADAGGAAQ